jgi:hypothetical protein
MVLLRHPEFDRILFAFQVRYGKYDGEVKFNKWVGTMGLDEGTLYVWGYSAKRKRRLLL